jgi:AcrR family transcriptional regulator
MGRKKMGDTRRRQILDGMLDAMAERGLMNTNMADVAKAAGLSKGILHYYFKNKDEMIAAMVAHLKDNHLSNFRALVEDIPDPWQALKDSLWYPVKVYGTGGASLAKVWIEFWGLAPHNDAVHDFILQVQHALRSHFREIIQRGIDSGAFPNEIDPQRLASVILSVMEGLIVQWRMNPENLLVSENITELERMLEKYLRI